MAAWWYAMVLLFGEALSADPLSAEEYAINEATQSDNAEIVKYLDGLDKLLQMRFIARVEISTFAMTGTSKNYTQTVTEKHDPVNGIHSVKFEPAGDHLFLYDNAEPKTFVRYRSANGFACTALKASEAARDPSNFLVVPAGAVRNNRFLLGPTAIIKEIPRKDILEIAPQREVVRGIYALKTTLRATSTAGVVNYTLYFPVDWTMHVITHEGRPLFPLRIVRNSTVNQQQVVTSFDFYQVDDLCKKTDRLHGNVPPFAKGCRVSIASNKTQPVLDKRFSFVVSVSDAPGFTTKEWYDTVGRVSRCDVTWPSDAYSSFNSRAATGSERQTKATVSITTSSTTIHDDVHGLVYRMAAAGDGSGARGGTCVIQAGGIPGMSSLTNGGVCPGAVVARAFLMPEKYYIGPATVRGIPVDVWEAVGGKDLPADAARFFLTSGTLTSAGGSGGSRVKSGVPIRVELRTSQNPNDGDGSTMRFELFDYQATDDGAQFAKNFDVTDCHRERSYAELVFQSNDRFDPRTLSTSGALGQLSTALRERMLNSLDISSLQLPYVEFHVAGDDADDNQRVVATMLLLSPPPYLASFVERVNQTFQHFESSGHVWHSQTRESCAMNCVRADCQTMLVCADGDCNLLGASWGSPSKNKDCVAFDKSPATMNFTYWTFEQTMAKLSESVKVGSLAFRLNVSTEAGRLIFVPVELRSHISHFNDRSVGGPYSVELEKRTLDPNHPASRGPIDGLASTGECYRECVDDRDGACASFSYCPLLGRCTLSGLNVNNGTNPDPEQAAALLDSGVTDCAVYSLNFLGQFEHLAGRTRASGSLASDSGATAGDCARLCRRQRYDALESDCRGFDFCPAARKCFFYDTHYSWGANGSSPADAPSQFEWRAGCDHYALRFSADYTAVGRDVLDVPGSVTVNDISMDECSRRCSEFSDGNCKSMAVCMKQTKSRQPVLSCHLYPVELEKAPKHRHDPDCTLYMRGVDVREMIRPSRHSNSSHGTAHKGMTSGALAVLLIFMMAIGSACGVVGFYYKDKLELMIPRRRPRSEAPTSSSNPTFFDSTLTYNRQNIVE